MGLSADSLPSNCRTIYSGITLIFSCEVIKTESSDQGRTQGGLGLNPLDLDILRKLYYLR